MIDWKKRLALGLGVTALVAVLGVLGLAVWRVSDLRTVLQRPKASDSQISFKRFGDGESRTQAPASENAFSTTTGQLVDGHYISDLFVHEFFVINGGTAITGYSAGLETDDGFCQWMFTNPNTITISNNQFSFNYNGYIASGVFNTLIGGFNVTARLENLLAGSCGNATGDLGSDTVLHSVCSSAGHALCNGTCVNIITDSNNCGSCGNACTSNQHCSGGFCVAGSATGNGQCVAPSQTHLACGANNTCVRKIGAGSNLGGCTTTGASCGGQTTCTSDTQCTDTKKCTNNQCVDVCPPPSQLTVCQTASATNHWCTIVHKPNGTSCGSNVICVGGTCGSGHMVCTNNACTWIPGLGDNATGCTVGGDRCVSSDNEANTCWGNGGVSGKCYDCDGNGVINVLDFSCFRKRYGNTVT